MRRLRTDTIKYLTLAEFQGLLKAIDNIRDRAIFLIGYRHGLRASEIGLLQVLDLDFKAMRISLHRLKGSLSGTHPLQPDEMRILKPTCAPGHRARHTSSSLAQETRSAVGCSIR